jgi:endonuclease G, mitochondrial
VPNMQGIKGNPWRAYRKTVREVETLTGYNFFSNLPQPIQDSIENRLDDR